MCLSITTTNICHGLHLLQSAWCMSNFLAFEPENSDKSVKMQNKAFTASVCLRVTTCFDKLLLLSLCIMHNNIVR